MTPHEIESIVIAASGVGSEALRVKYDGSTAARGIVSLRRKAIDALHANGMSFGQIAAHFGLSPKSVANHRSKKKVEYKFELPAGIVADMNARWEAARAKMVSDDDAYFARRHEGGCA